MLIDDYDNELVVGINSTIIEDYLVSLIDQDNNNELESQFDELEEEYESEKI